MACQLKLEYNVVRSSAVYPNGEEEGKRAVQLKKSTGLVFWNIDGSKKNICKMNIIDYFSEFSINPRYIGM